MLDEGIIMSFIYLGIALVLVIINGLGLYYFYKKKTDTLEYRVKNFVRKNSLKTKMGHLPLNLSEDVLKQLFLRDNNEDLRKDLSDKYKLKEFYEILDTFLDREEEDYLVNGDSSYLHKPAPTAPPLSEYGDDYIDL